MQEKNVLQSAIKKKRKKNINPNDEFKKKEKNRRWSFYEPSTSDPQGQNLQCLEPPMSISLI